MLFHEDITEKIISSFYKLYNELGFGFLEQVYENALLIELSSLGLICSKQLPVKVYYAAGSGRELFCRYIGGKQSHLRAKGWRWYLIEKHELRLTDCLRGTGIEEGL